MEKINTIHFSLDEVTAFCGTKTKTVPTVTLDKELVTCKRCLKKLSTPVKVKKVSKAKKEAVVGKGGISFTENEKHGYCLTVGRDTLLRLGKKLSDKIGVMMLMSDLGMMSTSMKLAGDVEQLISHNEAVYLRDWFQNKKKDNNGLVFVSDVMEAFTVEAK